MIHAEKAIGIIYLCHYKSLKRERREPLKLYMILNVKINTIHYNFRKIKKRGYTHHDHRWVGTHYFVKSVRITSGIFKNPTRSRKGRLI